MTYSAFLAVVLGGGLAVAAAGWFLAVRTGILPASGAKTVVFSLAGLSLLALVYTTPWDNFLVASGVWTYPANRVWGVHLGWVPLEEYLFFMLQPLLTGSVAWLILKGRIRVTTAKSSTPHLRRAAVSVLAAVWVPAWGLLAGGSPHGRYLALILIWGLPPLALQAGFGADLLWSARKPVAAALASTTTYLILADSWAIRSGIWSITPAQSLPFRPLGFPLEEGLFFLVTNALVVFSTAFLVLPSSRARWRASSAWRLVTRARRALGQTTYRLLDPTPRLSRGTLEHEHAPEGVTDT